MTTSVFIRHILSIRVLFRRIRPAHAEARREGAQVLQGLRLARYGKPRRGDVVRARHAVPQHPSPETGASCNTADPDYSRQNSSTSSVLIRRIRVDPWFIPPGDNIRANPCSIPRTRYQAGARSIARYGLQNATTPPSPLVGEGGRGDEGAKTTPPSPLVGEGGRGDEGAKTPPPSPRVGEGSQGDEG
jgi:hypothetical protein